MAILLLAAARFAVAGDQAGLVLEVEEGGKSFVNLENHVAAASAVTAGGSAKRAVFLAEERDCAVPALAGLHINSGFVDKAHTRAKDYISLEALARQLSSTTPVCNS